MRSSSCHAASCIIVTITSLYKRGRSCPGVSHPGANPTRAHGLPPLARMRLPIGGHDLRGTLQNDNHWSFIHSLNFSSHATCRSLHSRLSVLPRNIHALLRGDPHRSQSPHMHATLSVRGASPATAEQSGRLRRSGRHPSLLCSPSIITRPRPCRHRW